LNIINDSKFYISTARYEGLPYSIIESLALSKPCLVSNCDGHVDLIKDGFNGFVVSDENIDTYVEKALYLLSDEKALKQFSNNAFTSFNEDYNISKNMATFTNINAQDKFNFIQKLNKLEDSKSDSYVFRKQINYSLANSFIHKEIPTFSSHISPVKQNLKSQAEELQKLQSEVFHLEEKVRELDNSKKSKLVKVSLFY
jgi:hypothetical protein